MLKQFTHSFLLIGLAVLVYASVFFPNICDTFFDLNNCNGTNYTSLFAGLFLFWGVFYLLYIWKVNLNFSIAAKRHFYISISLLSLNQSIIAILNPDRASIEFITILSLLLYIILSIFLIIHSFLTIKKKK